MIVQDWPPNIADIRAVLPVSEKNIFAYGGKIYSPSTATLPAWLVAHEEIHFAQQSDVGLRSWWSRFLADPEFRLSQELPAHQVEYRAFCAMHRDRNLRSRYLFDLGRRMSAPMYGGMITAEKARKEIAK